jgi:membrane-associated phospholipid phosphatase
MSFHRPFLLFLVIALTSLTGAAQSSPEPAPENDSPRASAAQSPAPPSAQAASPAASGAPALEKNLLQDLLKDQKAILLSPKQLKNADTYKFFVPFLAGTAALLATDRRTSEGISDSRDIRNVSRNISYAGTAYSTLGISGGLYFLGKATDKPYLRDTGILSLRAVTNSLILIGGIKLATNRKRPLDGGGGNFFNGGKSFASGHAVGSWALATVVAHRYPKKPLLQATAYGAAALISASRVSGKNHFASDVLVGATLGYLIGRFTVRQAGGAPDAKPAAIVATPFFSPATRGYGLTVSARW